MPRIYSDQPDEGPRTITIPASNRTTCGTCKYHRCTGGVFTRLGPGGWREYGCAHPDAYEPVTDGDAQKAEIRGMLRALDHGMRHIGRTENTPEWCPYLRRND